MPTADLLTRARSAVTRDEECDVIRSALADAYPPGDDALCGLVNIVLRVSIGELPRPVLLGVVAALVPEGMGLGVTGPYIHADGMTHWEASCGPLDEIAGNTPALALLIAILEAANVEA